MVFTKALALLALSATALASNPKRGMISDFDPPTQVEDAKMFTSPRIKQVSWYHSFGHYPQPQMSTKYQFVMQQFGINEAPDADGNNWQNLKTLMSEVDKTRPAALLTFLEPVGHGISVEDAVKAWRKYIIPIKKKYPRMPIGSPQVLNDAGSLPWIRKFQKQCPECKFDFLDVHFYWSWMAFRDNINMWRKEFPKKPMWITDIGIQDYNADGTQTGMCKEGDNQCVPKIEDIVEWMDSKPWIKRYTFRGEFRRGNTGRGAEGKWGWDFLSKDGKSYTPLGRWYLGIYD